MASYYFQPDFYYTAFPNDNKICQTVVYGVYALEIAQTIMITHDAFQNFVYGFGKVSALDDLQVLWFDTAIMDGVVAFVVQTYFAYRIYLLSRSKIIPGIALFVALVQLGGAVATGVEAKIVTRWSAVRDAADVPVVIWLAGSAFGDVVTACALTYVLSKNDSGFQDTRAIVKRIIRLTIETGALTAVFAFLDLVLYLVYPKRIYHIVCALVLAKLYSNSLLAVYNSRIRIPNARGCHRDATRPTGVVVTTNNEIVFRRPDDHTDPNGGQIRIDIEEVSDTSSDLERNDKRESGSSMSQESSSGPSQPEQKNQLNNRDQSDDEHEQNHDQERPEEREEEHQFLPPPQPSRFKRVSWLILIGVLVWFAFFSKNPWFGKKEPQVVHAKRYSKEFKYRPAASPIITETLKDGRLRVRGAEPTSSTETKPTPEVKKTKKKKSTGTKKGKRTRQRAKKIPSRDEF
ncbi:hypothetical protein V5O48_008420 [Marasmius crinis-equi]|uniref:DUF6534 domain-containing protein n=1 Tax=Marasmius crinis-equi TaxID=585013 RepID=A0ABR3FEG4_9AGAR